MYTVDTISAFIFMLTLIIQNANLHSHDPNLVRTKKSISKEYIFLKNFRAVHRLLFCLGLAALVFTILIFIKVEVILCVILGWSSFSLFMILTSWVTIFTTSSKELCILAKEQDESRAITFLIVLISVCISLLGTLFLIQNTDEGIRSRNLSQRC